MQQTVMTALTAMLQMPPSHAGTMLRMQDCRCKVLADTEAQLFRYLFRGQRFYNTQHMGPDTSSHPHLA
jgi:hypothetical protein